MSPIELRVVQVRTDAAGQQLTLSAVMILAASARVSKNRLVGTRAVLRNQISTDIEQWEIGLDRKLVVERNSGQGGCVQDVRLVFKPAKVRPIRAERLSD